MYIFAFIEYWPTIHDGYEDTLDYKCFTGS